MKQNNRTNYYRVIKNRNYTVISNVFMKDDQLSWKAKGILAYILTLPDDWKINKEELSKHATDGFSSFRVGWKELEERGYIKRYPVKDKKSKKIKYWQTDIFESPNLVVENPQVEKPQVENPQVEKPQVENPQVEKPQVENRTLLSTYNTKYLNILNTNNTNNNNYNREERKNKNLATNVFSYWEEQGFGTLSPFVIENILYDIQEFGGGHQAEEIIKLAMNEAIKNNVRKYSYIKRILESWQQKGVKDLDDAKAIINSRHSKKDKDDGGDEYASILGF